MAILSRWLQLVSLTCALSRSAVAKADYDDVPDLIDLSTGVTQFHQVFPRNDTYVPSPWFPFVFAFQKPTVAQSLTPLLSAGVAKWNESTRDWDRKDYLDFNFLMELGNGSDTKPFFVSDVMSGDLDTEAFWRFHWSIAWSNCTRGEGRELEAYAEQRWDHVYFTTKKGGQEFGSSSNDSQCSDFPSLTWNITYVSETYPQGYQGQTCPFFSPVKPDPEPCKVQVDSKVQERIFASATQKFCQDIFDGVPCPSSKDNNDDEEDHGETLNKSLAATFAACFASFAIGMGLFMV